MQELIEYAQRRLDDACKNGTYEDCRYWAGYLDGLKSALSKFGVSFKTNNGGK